MIKKVMHVWVTFFYKVGVRHLISAFKEAAAINVVSKDEYGVVAAKSLFHLHNGDYACIICELENWTDLHNLHNTLHFLKAWYVCSKY